MDVAARNGTQQVCGAEEPQTLTGEASTGASGCEEALRCSDPLWDNLVAWPRSTDCSSRTTDSALSACHRLLLKSRCHRGRN